MIGRSFRVALCCLLVLPAIALAQIERQHHAHVHGTATGNLAIDGEIMRLELEIPGVNLVGFEHAPVDADQQTSLDQTIEFLRSATWLEADPQGQCEIATVSAHTHGFDSGGGHEHHHDHEHHEHGHSEFHLVVTMECEAPVRVGCVDLQLFDRYPGNEEMLIDVLTMSLATQARLTAGQSRIELDG